jgi:uncharacterized membrane protein YdbT with pleckstrin-like domain
MSDFLLRKLNFKENEEVIKIVRRYLLTCTFSILITLVLVSGSFFFLSLFFSWGPIGVALFSAILLLGIIYGTREFVLWYFNAFIITNQRVIDIDQRGFFDRIVSEAPYEKIQDVSYRVKGIFQTLFHYGNIQIQTAGMTMRLELKNIRQPGKINELITYLAKKDQTKREQELQKNVSSNSGGVEKVAGSDFEILKAKLNNLDGDQLSELDKKIKEEMRDKMVRSLQDE